MKIQGAVVKEQGVTFAIVIVKERILQSKEESNDAIISFGPVFPGVPIILMAQNMRGVPTYYGRKDIVGFLSSIDYRRIPWKEYAFN